MSSYKLTHTLSMFSIKISKIFHSIYCYSHFYLLSYQNQKTKADTAEN